MSAEASHLIPSPLLRYIFQAFDQLPVGFFAAAFIFDVTYIYSYMPMWTSAATWLIAIGLCVAIIPRLINFIWLILPKRNGYRVTTKDKVGFWGNAIGIAIEIANAFVHSRDAYAVVPTGMLLSGMAVVVIVLSNAYDRVNRL